MAMPRPLSRRNSPPVSPGSACSASDTIDHDEQQAAQEPRRHEERQRIVEVRRERVVLALTLGLEALRQAHQQREGQSRRARKRSAQWPRRPRRPRRPRSSTRCRSRVFGTADEPARQAGPPSQALLHLPHLPLIGVMIVAQQVQQAMEGQDAQLCGGRVPEIARLALAARPVAIAMSPSARLKANGPGPRHASSPCAPWALGLEPFSGKRQHICDAVLAAERAIEPPHRGVADERD